MQYFQYTDENYKSVLDPRTKLIMLIAINVVVMMTGFTGIDYVLRIVCAAIPFVCFFIIHKPKAALIYGAVCAVMLFTEGFIIPNTNGALNLVVVFTTGAFSRFLAGMAFAYYVFASTTVSEFITAMKRMHMPDVITIPLSVMFRFFPTLGEEASAISDAMRMRGIGLGGTKGGVLSHVEYIMVPLMMSTLRIGDELSAASLTKGLDSGKPRTHICRVGMGVHDWLLVVLSIGMLVYMLFLR
ncbi:MAG: energy-coupling factor transporter transmembrane protein EcfT [Eggerthellaceae bacterium]|nr:energy-coupling factor transporter transmembrane protein EcfT [Eggerthellaceae bacterium]